MSKDTRESARDKGAASPVDEDPFLAVPPVEIQRDKFNGNAVAYTLAVDSEGTMVPFFLERRGVENTIREHESISEDDAVVLARHIKDLYLRHPFDGRADYIASLAGQCLTLKEGSTMPDECITASAQLKVPPRVSFILAKLEMPPIVSFNLAIPAGLDRAFGVQSFTWLWSRCESVARELGRRRFPSISFTDHFGFVPGHARHVRRDSKRESEDVPVALAPIPVVPAPNEATITEYIRHAASKADYWDALVKAAAMLREYQQSAGDALQGWLIEAADRETRRPDGRKAAKWPKDALRDYAIIEAVSPEISPRGVGMGFASMVKVVDSNHYREPRSESHGDRV